jgi:cell division protein ZapA
VSDTSTDVVIVEIFGQRYPVRSSLEPAYVSKIANYVDQKMQAAADRTRGGDSVRVAVLAALNIADEYFRTQESDASDGADVKRLAIELEQLVDAALAQAPSP